MKKIVKGFTLVEMLGAVIILSILILIAIPTVNNWIVKSKEEAYTAQIKIITTSAANWASSNASLMPTNDNGKVSFTIGQLKKLGFLDNELENPKTKKEFSNDTIVTIAYVNGGYEYNVGNDGGDNLNGYEKEAPIINLYGDLVVYLELNIDEFKEPGYVALNSDGNNISEKVTVYFDKEIDNKVNNVTFTITYMISDKGYTTIMKRNVIVRDTTIPTLEIGENFEIYEDEALKINLLEGIVSTDNDTFKPTIKVINFDNIPGEKLVTYIAKDLSGNETTKRKTIIVKPSPIEITFTPQGNPFNESGWAKSNFYIKAEAISKNSNTIKEIKWCTTTSEECTPNVTVNNNFSNVYITNENSHNVVCMSATNIVDYTTTKCSDPYKLDKTGPILSGINDIIINRHDIVDLINSVNVTDALSGLNGSYAYNPTSVDTSVAGTTNITYTASDIAGNVTTIIKKIIVDAQAPKITYVMPNVFNNKGWAKANFNVNVTVQDLSGLGLKEVKYCKTTASSCTPNVTANGNFNVTIDIDSSSNRICTVSTDNNNKTSSVVCSDILKLDKVINNPVITLNASGITMTHSDSISGTDSIYYSLSGATTLTETKYTSGFAITNNGTTTITVYAVDNAGNITSKITRNVVISAPACNSATCNYSYNATASSNSYSCYSSCPSGWSASGSQCSTGARYSDGYYFCPSGWTRSGSSCSKYVSYPLSSTEYLSGTCSSSGRWNFSTTGCSGNCNNACSGGLSYSGGGLTNNSCPSGSCTSGRTTSCSKSYAASCSGTDVQSASWSSGYSYCDSGTLSGGSCYTSRPTTTCYETVYSCNSGHNLSGTTCSYSSSSCSSGTYSSTLNKCYS